MFNKNECNKQKTNSLCSVSLLLVLSELNYNNNKNKVKPFVGIKEIVVKNGNTIVDNRGHDSDDWECGQNRCFQIPDNTNEDNNWFISASHLI